CNYLRCVLYHLIADYHRRAGKRAKPCSTTVPEPAAMPPTMADCDRAFLASWRDELLARAWTRLQALEKEHDQPFFTVLKFRAEHSEMKSLEMARQLSAELSRPMTAA